MHAEVLMFPQSHMQIQWLPHALKTSSVTEEGLDDLKQAVLDLMAEENWAAQAQAMLDRDSQSLNDLSHET